MIISYNLIYNTIKIFINFTEKLLIYKCSVFENLPNKFVKLNLKYKFQNFYFSVFFTYFYKFYKF